jgi:hypothetical protein
LEVRAAEPGVSFRNGFVEIRYKGDTIYRVGELSVDATRNTKADIQRMISGARSSGQRIKVSKDGLSIEGPAPKISSDEASRLSTRIEALEKRIETLEKTSGKCCKTDPGFAPETQADGAHK